MENNLRKLIRETEKHVSEKIQNELTEEGLRIASESEPGWYWKSHDEDGNRITLWVTEE